MNAKVNENCIGCGLCNSICPEVFTMTDEGVATAKNEIATDLEDSVHQAADSCPVDAIELEE